MGDETDNKLNNSHYLSQILFHNKICTFAFLMFLYSCIFLPFVSWLSLNRLSEVEKVTLLLVFSFTHVRTHITQCIGICPVKYTFYDKFDIFVNLAMKPHTPDMLLIVQMEETNKLNQGSRLLAQHRTRKCGSKQVVSLILCRLRYKNAAGLAIKQ